MTADGRAKCRIGVDVGGTFTDFVLSDPVTGQLIVYKEPSTPHDPSFAVERGLTGLLDRAGLNPGAIEIIVHGTTLGLNAIIQRRGARTALVVSRGNRDVLELARSKMPSPYDFSIGKEEPLVPRDLVFELDARMAADGTVIEHPDGREIGELAGELRSSGVQAVAVALLNSYVDPALEAEVAAQIEDCLGHVLITRSAVVWPEIREYERASIATMNAYIHPLLDKYYATLQRRLVVLGHESALYITASNGGTLSVDTARQRPVDTLLSGPASGVVAAARVAELADRKAVITIDMGGTSCDMAICQSGEPEYTTRTHVGDFPLVAPVVNVSAIGAGGGSVVWVDTFGIIKVGPESAGADPGPVSYGRGGVQATVTDCYLTVGYIVPEAFLGGRMRLDRNAAAQALEGIADRLDFTGGDRAARAAEAALRVATARMATELYKGLAQRGLDPRGFTLIPYGGAGPTHSGLLAREARLRSILVPASPGTFCALGAILSNVKRDFVRTVRKPLDTASDTLRSALDGMEAEATAWVNAEGDHLLGSSLSYTADMRYVGQAYELTVAVPPEERAALTPERLAELFHAEHARVYGFPDHGSPVEVISIRLRVTGMVPPLALPTLERAEDSPPEASRRHVFFEGDWIEVPVYQRRDLRHGQKVIGPAIVEQEDSTTWILPAWAGRVDAQGGLVLRTG